MKQCPSVLAGDPRYCSLLLSPHVCGCAPDAIQPEEGEASALGIHQPLQVSGSTTAPNSTRKSMFACAAALLQNLNEL